MLEVTIIDATGEIVIANECQHSDLFYAMRGGGYGFGIVVSLTVRTHPIPKRAGGVLGSIQSKNEDASLKLIEKFLFFYQKNLNPLHWGEKVHVTTEGLSFDMTSLDLSQEESELQWQPLKDWVETRPQEYTGYNVHHYSLPFKCLWNGTLEQSRKDGTLTPYDPKEHDRAYFWKVEKDEIFSFYLKYITRYLMNSQILDDPHLGAQKLLKLAKKMDYQIYLHMAQSGASQWARDELAKTPVHPNVKNSFALILSKVPIPGYSPLVPKHLQNQTSVINDWVDLCGTDVLEDCWYLKNQNIAMEEFRQDTPGAGAYFNIPDYFEPSFQEAFWGSSNYNILYKIKQHSDPYGLFYCHNCVGSEDWEEGGIEVHCSVHNV